MKKIPKPVLYGGAALLAGIAYIYYKNKQGSTTPAAKTVTRVVRAPQATQRPIKVYVVPKRGFKQ